MAEADMPLAGKVALVTGGAKGIGFLRLSHPYYRRSTGHKTAAERMQKSGQDALGLEADVTSEQDVAHLAQSAAREFAGLQMLINNAAIFSTLKRRPFEEIDPAEWRRVMEVNTLGPFLFVVLSCAAEKRVAAHQSSTSPRASHSKAILVWPITWRTTELGPFKILVNGVAPGSTHSEGVENPDLLAGAREFSVRTQALAREMTPADLVGTMPFLAGPDSAFVTGQTIVVDGGGYYH